MAKRLTADQKEAVKKYWQAVEGMDRYLASVFVSDAQTSYYKRLLNERAAKCAELGVPQELAVEHIAVAQAVCEVA